MTRAGGWLLGLAAAAAAAVSRGRRWSLRDRVVLVAGGSRGLGLAIARRLVREGARVAICGRDRDTLERARADLAGCGGTVLRRFSLGRALASRLAWGIRAREGA